MESDSGYPSTSDHPDPLFLHKEPRKSQYARNTLSTGFMSCLCYTQLLPSSGAMGASSSLKDPALPHGSAHGAAAISKTRSSFLWQDWSCL